MSKIYKVNTSQEAFELAIKFKKIRKYDLFRGQNEDWPLVASINRLSSKKRKEAVDKLFAFKLFLSDYKITKEYADSLDHIVAIAQHYGIPTDFVDFTYSPEIATFFATYSKKDLTGKNGVILCVNRGKFQSLMRLLKVISKERGLPVPYLFEPDIASLWRLKAQYGCFLQLMLVGIENLYNFDKIIFPHNNEISTKICVTDVYPENKSDLEIILDNYFAALNIDEGARRLKRFSQKMDMEIVEMPAKKVYKYVKSRKSHSSWQASSTKAWRYEVSNSFSKAKDIEFTIQIRSHGDFKEDIYQIEQQLSKLFKEYQITRKQTINPTIKFIPAIRSRRLSSLVSKNIKRMWDGMRTLPYTPKQIRYSIAKYLALELYDSVKKEDIESLYHSPILISLSDPFGAYCRCLVSRISLRWAIREDILDIQSDVLPKSVSTDLLLYIQKAKVVFDFDELVYLFHYEIIPSQMLRSKYSKNPTLFFSPIYVDRLGYA